MSQSAFVKVVAKEAEEEDGDGEGVTCVEAVVVEDWGG